MDPIHFVMVQRMLRGIQALAEAATDLHAWQRCPGGAVAAHGHARHRSGIDWVWQFGLYPIDGTRTRLVSRSRVRARAVWARLLTHAIEPAGFLMTRRMLLGLKQRTEAEALRAASMIESRANRRSAA